MSKIFVGVILGVIIAGAVFYAYNLGKTQSIPTPSPTQKISISSPTPSPVIEHFSLRERPTAGFTDPSGTIAKINDAFNKGADKTLGADLGFWMANKIDVILFATECCGSKNSKEAMNQLDAFAVKGIDPWNCSDTNPITKQILAKDPVSFKDMTICTSANGLLVGFHLDNEFLIDRMSLVNDYKQITGP